MKQPARRAQVTYKKPSALNPVSFMLLALVGAIGYAGYCYWPTLRMKSNAKSEAQDFIMQFYRMNLRQDKARRKDLAALENTFRTRLVEVGVTDPNLKIGVNLDSALISIDLEFVSQFELVGLDKRYPLSHKVNVETDAKRVEW